MRHDSDMDFINEAIEEPTEITFYVAGVQFRQGWKAELAKLTVGDELVIVPEPDNQYDSDAVQLHNFDGVFLGYAPAKTGGFKNRWILNRMAEGRELKAVIEAVDPEAKPYQALKVRVV